MISQVKAKFRVNDIKNYAGSDGSPQVSVSLNPVYGDSEENKTWSKYTPSGSLNMSITNPNVVGFFELNKEYFLNIEPAS